MAGVLHPRLVDLLAARGLISVADVQPHVADQRLGIAAGGCRF